MRRLIGLVLLLILATAAFAGNPNQHAGYAIQRQDGTYRAWNAFTKDDALLPGEAWVQLDAMPVIGPSLAEQNTPTASTTAKTKIDAMLADPAVPQSVKDALSAIRATLPP